MFDIASAALDWDLEIITQLTDDNFHGSSTDGENKPVNVKSSDPYKTFMTTTENPEWQWLYFSFQESIRVDGVMVLTDHDNMNDGTFHVSVYSGEPVMDIIMDSRAAEAKCEGIGENA